MKQGIIIEVKKHYSIALSEGNYYKIHNKKNMIEGMNLLFTNEDRVGGANSHTRTVPVFRYASVAAAFVLVLMMSLMYYNNNLAVYSVVTMDINPSVEVLLNDSNEVRKVKAMNEDGESLLDVKVKGLPIDEAIALLVAEAKADGFVKNDGDAFIVVTAVPIKDKDDGEHIEEIEALIEARIDQNNLLREITVAIMGATEEELEVAKATDKPLPLVAMKNKGKAKEAKTVRDVYEDPVMLQEMAEQGKVLGNSRLHRNDLQVILDKLTLLDSNFSEKDFLDGVDPLTMTKDELKQLKEDGKELLAMLKPDDADEEDEADEPYEGGPLAAVVAKIEAILDNPINKDIDIAIDEEVQKFIRKIKKPITKEDNEKYLDEARTILKALQKAGFKAADDDDDGPNPNKEDKGNNPGKGNNGNSNGK